MWCALSVALVLHMVMGNLEPIPGDSGANSRGFLEGMPISQHVCGLERKPGGNPEAEGEYANSMHTQKQELNP